MRLLAALTIFWAHQHDLSRVPRPLSSPDLALVALLTFFAISGYLNTISLLSRRDPRAFLISRALRIYPALLGGAFFMVCLGAVVTNLHLFEYLRSGQVWTFVFRNITLIVSGVSYKLPGVEFPFSLDANSVNGSLWSLPYEVDLYLFLVAALLLCRYGARGVYIAIGAALVGLVLASSLAHDPKVLPGIRLSYLSQFAIAFFAGGLIAALERRGISAAISCMVCAAVGIIAAVSDQKVIAYAMIVVSIAALIGRLSAPLWMIPKVDISYGVYIYAFPVQQIVIGYQLDSFWSGYFIALAVTVLLAFASHFLIEAPALRLKRRFAYPSPRLSARPNALRHEKPTT